MTMAKQKRKTNASDGTATEAPAGPAKEIKRSDEAREFVYDLKIPKDRVAALIGSKGRGKREIERLTRTRLDVDSKEGDVRILGEEALDMYNAREIVQAIGRGFSPERALTLLKQENGFDMINLKDYAKNDGDMVRLRGRVIGEEGKSRRLIEEMTGAYISVYGKTVGIIGEMDGVPVARRAIEALLAGSKHATVYKWLEEQRRRIRQQQLASGGF